MQYIYIFFFLGPWQHGLGIAYIPKDFSIGLGGEKK